MKPIIVSFYTPAYADEAMAMKKTAGEFGLVADVRAVPDLGDWTLNCAQKPPFIRDRMLDYPGRPVIWLDADARIRKRPALLIDGLDGCDFAAHWRHGTELLSGTMFWGNTPGAWRLVQAWCDEQKRTPHVWDQRVLQAAAERMEGLNVQRLPASYTRVFDDPKMGEPVIEHLQASRRLAKT